MSRSTDASPIGGFNAAAPTDADIDNFIALNSVLDNEWAPSNNCCVCLESFDVSGEPCHRMTVAGCSHHFGRTCLFKLMKIEPMEEKKCPLCRTVWQPPLFLNRPTLGEIIWENSLAPLVPVANPFGPPTHQTSTGSAPAGNRTALESNPHDDYATRLSNHRRYARDPDGFVSRAERRANDRKRLERLERRGDRSVRPANRPTQPSNDRTVANERANTSNNGGVLEGLYLNAFNGGENTNQQRDSSTQTDAPATGLVATPVNEGSQLPRTEQTPFLPHAPVAAGPSIVQSLGQSFVERFPRAARALEDAQIAQRQSEEAQRLFEQTSNLRRADGQGTSEITANLRARIVEFDRLSARYDAAAREHAVRLREGELLTRTLALDRRQRELDTRETALVARETQAAARINERSTWMQNSQNSLIARLENLETEIRDIQTTLRNSPLN